MIGETDAPMRIAVVTPAYNEAGAIGRVATDVPRAFDVDGRRVEVVAHVVVDNGSTDATADVARAAGCVVVPEPRRGYGQACQTGVAAVRAFAPDVLVFLDGDRSDHADELPRVVAPIVRGDAVFVVGSRTRGARERGALLPQAVVGNALACVLLRWRWGVRWTDLGPFRAIALAAYDRLGMTDTTYGWTVEMQARAAMLGLPSAEVPVSYRRRIGTSKITGTVKGTVRASVKILATIGALAGRRAPPASEVSKG